MFDKRIINGQVYTENGFEPLNLYINGEKIARVCAELAPAKETVDATGLFVMPGLIDAHVHLNLMGGGGNLSSDNYRTGSITAAYGGITTMIDFLGEAATVDEMRAFLKAKQSEADGALIDYAWHTSVRDLDDLDEADKIANEAVKAGVPTIKLYTTYAIMSSPKTLEAMIRRSAKGDIRIIIHAEDHDLIDHEENDARKLAEARPPECEWEEVRKIAAWTRAHDGNTYIVHVNCGSTIEMLKCEFADILQKNLFLESCPQYFVFDKSVYENDDYYRYTITPPLRSKEEQRKLFDHWREIQVFATDHCPFSLEAKQSTGGQLKNLPMGMGGMEYLFRTMYDLFGDEAISRLTDRPAKLFGLYPQKGVFREGSDADVVLFKKEAATLDALHSAGDDSPYLGRSVKTRILSTMCRGTWVMRDGEINENHRGQFVFGTLRQRPETAG